MTAPQVTIIVLWAVTFTASLYAHGTPRTGKHNVLSTAISIGIGYALLNWGGFFDPRAAQ